MENRVKVVGNGPANRRVNVYDLTLAAWNIHRKELVDSCLRQATCDEVSCQIDLEERIKRAICRDLVSGNF